ncbi:hypothetical protein N2152v2_001844 [Parachlorella kessleri]
METLCWEEFMPDYQWAMTQNKDPAATSTQVLIDIGIVITSRYGSESNRAAVDLAIYDPAGAEIHREEGISETELAVSGEGGQVGVMSFMHRLAGASGQAAGQLGALWVSHFPDHLSVSPVGSLCLPWQDGVAAGCNSLGPWRACFRVSRGQILRPSVIVKVSYFTINQMTLVGTSFEWERDAAKLGVNPGQMDTTALGSAEQVAELSQGLQRLDHLLLNVTHEQRYLYARSVRHLRTVQSTHSRTLWYQLLIYFFIVLTSFAQAVGVRLMFKNNRRGQGLII